MKIVIITPYYTPIKGGITTDVENLVKSIRKKMDFDVRVISWQGGNKKYLSSKNKIYFTIKTFLALLRLKPNVVHSFSSWFALAPGVLYKLFNRSAKLIFTFLTLPLAKDAFKSDFRKRVFEFLLSYVNWVSADSKFLIKRFEEFLKLPLNKKAVYPAYFLRPVTSEEVEKFKEKSKIKDGMFTATAVSVFAWKEKSEGVKIMLEAWQKVVEKAPNSKLIIVGDGIFRTSIENYAKKLNINNQVYFAGYLDNVFTPLSISDLYLHISLRDSAPTSIIEALAFGKCVVATNVGGIPELITNSETGVLVPPDKGEIANKILELISNKDLMSELAAKGKLDAEKRFNIASYGEKYLKLYTEGKQ